MPAYQGRCWTITVKDWHYFDQVDCLKEIGDYQDEDGNYIVRYLSIGKHLGPQRGYQHCHINLEFEKRVTMTFIKRDLFGRSDIHCEGRKGTRQQCDTYLAKNGYFMTIVNRRETQPGRRTDLEHIREMVNDGKNLMDCFEEHFATTVRYTKGIKEYIGLLNRKRAREVEATDPEVIVFVGPAGSGKSYHCYNDEDFRKDGYRFPIQMQSKIYFDGYLGEKTIWFDEFSGRTMEFSKFCQLAQSYSGRYECKGGSVEIYGLKKILISTIAYPANWWAGSDRFNLDPNQLWRRLTKCYYLGPPRTTSDGVREFAIPLEFNPRELVTREQEEILKKHVKYPSDITEENVLDID